MQTAGVYFVDLDEAKETLSREGAVSPAPSNGGAANPSPSKGGAANPSPSKGGAANPSPSPEAFPEPSNGGAASHARIVPLGQVRFAHGEECGAEVDVLIAKNNLDGR